MNDIIYLHFISIVCAVIGFVYSDLLTQPNMIFHGPYKYLESKLGEDHWLFKPIIGCAKCVTGQIALWAFTVKFNYVTICNRLSSYEEILLLLNTVFFHIYYVCLSILIVWMLGKIN